MIKISRELLCQKGSSGVGVLKSSWCKAVVLCSMSAIMQGCSDKEDLKPTLKMQDKERMELLTLSDEFGDLAYKMISHWGYNDLYRVTFAGHDQNDVLWGCIIPVFQDEKRRGLGEAMSAFGLYESKNGHNYYQIPKSLCRIYPKKVL